MNDQDKSRQQLLAELAELRQRLAIREARTTRGQQDCEAVEAAAAASEDRSNPSRDQAELQHLNRAILDSIPDPVWIKHLDGRFAAVNKAWLRFTGLTLAGTVGRSDTELFTSEIAARIRDQELAVAATGQAQLWEESAPDEKGKLRTFETFRAPLFDSIGCVSGIIGIAREITERKRNEEALRVALVKYQTLFDSFPLGITFADSAGNILEANRMSERLLGVPKEDHIRRGIDGPEWRVVRLDGTPMPPSEYATVRALKEQRLVENVEMGVVKPDGSTTWLTVTAAPLPLDGYGVVVTYGDITERKLADEALRQSEAFIKTALDNLPIGVAVNSADPDVVFDYMNDNFAAFYRTCTL